MIALFMAGGGGGGGGGPRLWQLSRASDPKQLHALVGLKSLMEQTVERVAPLIEPMDIWIVTGRKYADRIAAQAPGVPPRQIIIEPFALGTHLALGARRVARYQPEAVILVGRADSHIGREAEFRAAPAKAVRIAPQGDGLILGASPTYPAASCGSIEIGAESNDCEGVFKIARFEEKPSDRRAEALFLSGRHLWNPGISV